MVGIGVSSMLIPVVPEQKHTQSNISLAKVMRNPLVMALLLVAFLNQAAHGTYYTFYTLYMESFDYSKGLIGLLWAVGVGVEVAVFIFMAKWIPRFGERNLMLVSLALAMVRWVVIALYPEDLTLIFIAQSFHAASFGVIHAVSIHLIHDLFRGKLQGRGQALYSSVSFGAGGVVGSLLGGIIWVSSGSSAIFIFSALLTLIAFIVTWIWIRPQQVDIFKLNS